MAIGKQDSPGVRSDAILPSVLMDQPDATRLPGKSEDSPSGGAPSRAKSSEIRALVVKPTVPDYELLRRIGHGAYGDVWLARSKATGALRAAKVVWRRSFDDDRPFQREFEGIQRFERISREHPSQLALFHIGRNDTEGCFYYVMELADQVSGAADVRKLTSRESEVRNLKSEIKFESPDVGCYSPHTLRADLEHGRLPASRVLEIGLALTEALAHLHQCGLVHRDVKPSNVIFVNGRPKLADIGLVTDASDQCSIVGTEGYLPPEGPGTPQADIFALGKVLYEAATGMDRREFPKLPEDIRKWTDAALVFELNEIILKACAPNSHERYANTGTMQEELQLLQRGQSVKRQRIAQWYWATGTKAGIGLAASAALTVSLVFLTRGFTPLEPNPDGPPSRNAEANLDCDKGLTIVRGDRYAQFGEAYTNFQSAISLDPAFARPYVGLLELGMREPASGLVASTPESIRRLAGKLKELAPHLAATSVAQSINSFYDCDFPDAERYALQAMKANPDYELAHTWYAHMLTLWRRTSEAREQLEISRSLALSQAGIYRGLGDTYFAQRDFTNALVWYGRALALERNHAENFFRMGRTLRALNDYSGFLTNMESGELLETKDKQAVKNKYSSLREAFNADGALGYWQQTWKLAQTGLKPDEGFYRRAVIQSQLGKTDEALALLKTSFQKHERIPSTGDCALNYLLFDEYWDRLRDDARLNRLLDDVGFTKVMMPAKR